MRIVGEVGVWLGLVPQRPVIGGERDRGKSKLMKKQKEGSWVEQLIAVGLEVGGAEIPAPPDQEAALAALDSPDDQAGGMGRFAGLGLDVIDPSSN